MPRPRPRSTVRRPVQLDPQRRRSNPATFRPLGWQLKFIDWALARSSAPDKLRERLPRDLKRAVRTFRALPENQGRRGVTWMAGRLIGRTLRRIELAIGHGDKHPDGNVRREAWRFVRACQSLSFDRIVQRSSEFSGQLSKAGRRRREKALRETAWRCRLGGSWELVQVTTVAWLRSVGRSLDLCVARCDGTGRHYHAKLREGGATFHTLQWDGVPQCLIEVDSATNEVNAAEGSGGRSVPLSRKRALSILRALGATADNVSAFANVGAFSPYLGAAKSVRLWSTIGHHRYMVDAFPSVAALVVRETPRLPSWRARTKLERWSLFKPEPTDGTQKLAAWQEVSGSTNCLSVGELLDLLLRDRELAEAARRLFVNAD